jgi:hypothetical protein
MRIAAFKAAAPALGAAVLALALAAPGAHAKARITLDPACYLSNEQGVLNGSGFKPNASWTAKLGGAKRLGSGRTDGRGRLRARFTAPAYRGTSGTRQYKLSVTDGPNVATVPFLMTPLDASFSPTSGDPRTLRVRWRVLGLGPRRGVYVHYIRPNGRLERTLRIGTTDPVCGALKTGLIALFPFDYALGRWTFQVDTSAKFRRTTRPRLLLAYLIRQPGGRDDRSGT